MRIQEDVYRKPQVWLCCSRPEFALSAFIFRFLLAIITDDISIAVLKSLLQTGYSDLLFIDCITHNVQY